MAQGVRLSLSPRAQSLCQGQSTHGGQHAQALRPAPQRHPAGTSQAQVLLQISAFITNYQLLNDGNRLAVVAAHHNSASVLYSDLHLISSPQADAATVPAAEVVITKLLAMLQGARSTACTGTLRRSCTGACINSYRVSMIIEYQ